MRLAGLIAVLFAGSHFVYGQERPRFTDYPVREFHKGQNAAVQIDSRSRMFRSRLKWAAKNQRPNFAGRYILTFWGCGASCIHGAAIDAKTGRVFWWTFSVVNGFDETVGYKLNSSLIVFQGSRGEDAEDDGNHYYKFDGKKFVHLKSVPKEEL